MGLLKYIQRLERIDQLIRLKATGSSNQFANKIGISRSMLMENLREMKEMGAPIVYCRHRETYYYSTECNLIIEFSNINSQSIQGGMSFFIPGFRSHHSLVDNFYY